MKPLGLILSSTLSNKKGCWQIFLNCMSSLLSPLTPAGFLDSRLATGRQNLKDDDVPFRVLSIGNHLVLLHLLVKLALQRAHPDFDNLFNLVG